MLTWPRTGNSADWAEYRRAAGEFAPDGSPAPYDAVAAVKGHVAFYPSRVDISEAVATA